MKLEKHRDWQIKRIKEEEARRKTAEDRFAALQAAVLEVVSDKEMFLINHHFDTNAGLRWSKRGGVPLLTRPFRSVVTETPSTDPKPTSPKPGV